MFSIYNLNFIFNFIQNERLSYFQEFIELVNEQNCLTALILPNLESVMEMIEKNIFRPLPILKKAPPPSEGIGAMEEEVLYIIFSLSHFSLKKECILTNSLFFYYLSYWRRLIVNSFYKYDYYYMYYQQ